MNLLVLRLPDYFGINSAKSLPILTSLIFSLFIFQNASAQNCSGNIVANGGFEQGLAGWNVIGGNATASTDANTGNGALELGGASGYNAINQAFAAQPNTYYTLRAFVKKNNSDNAQPQAIIKYYTSTWQPINSPGQRISNSTYEQLFFSRRSPANAAYVAVEFVYSTNSNNQKLLVDDICFMEEPNNSNCSISAQVVNLNCDDNGTPVNQLDDTYTAELNVSGSNLSSGFRLTKTNYFRDYGNYNSSYITEVLDIRDGNQEYVLTDLGNENCEYTITITPPPTCSNSGSGCDIDLTLTQPVCNNNGTPNNPLDDTYTFVATATGTNTGSGWNSSVTGFLSGFSGDYNVPTTIGPIDVYNSQTTWFGVRDNDSNSPCNASQNINGPLACSTSNPNVCPGSLLQNGGFSNGLNGWQISQVDFNGAIRTGIANVVPGGTFGQGVEICNDTQNSLFLSYIYQEFAVTPGAGKEGLVTWNYRRVSGDGNAHIRLYFEDAAGNSLFSQGFNPGFQSDWNTRSLKRGIPENATKVIVAYGINQGAPTSTGCVIFDELCFEVIGGTTPTCSLATNVNVTPCDNRNTSDPSDDIYDFVVDVTPTNGGTGYTAEWFENGATRIFNRTYPVGIGQQFNRISYGTLTLTLTDNADPTCQTTVAVVPPAPCSGSQGNAGDLELRATGSPGTIAAWQFGSSTFELRNAGLEPLSNVQVSFDLHPDAKLKGGDEYDASQGTLQSFWTQTPIWNVGTLAAGQSETIQLNIFTLGGGEMPIYGQVSSASDTESDSTPGNGTPPTPNEDDEAVFVFNGNGNPLPQPDLRMSNLSINNQPSAGAILNYNFDVINSGTLTASGNYNIKAYISTDNVLSNDDIQDGIVPTGNTPIGTIAAVPGASTLPGNLSQGNYYLILKIDADNQITESNEGNNTVSAPFSISGTATLPDLIIENVTSRNGSQVFIGQSVSAYFDGVNLDEPVPFSSFPITYSLYMSSNRILDGNDYKILDLDLGIGNMVQFGGQVPPNLTPGNYYLIVEIDSPNNIQESNENNNWTASTQTVEAVPVGNSCSFVKSYDTNGVATPGSNSYSFAENASGYQVESIVSTGFNPRTFVTRTYELDLNGDVQSLTDSPFTSNVDQTVALEIDANENLEMVFGAGSDLPVGTRVAVDIGNASPTQLYAPSYAYRTASGDYAFGLAVIDVSQTPLLRNIVIKTDNLGQNAQTFTVDNPDFYYGFSPGLEGPDGSLFFRLSTGGNYSLFGISGDGSSSWTYRVASDTPSSTWAHTEISQDGNYIYTAKTDNQQTVIAKIDVQTGTPTLIDLSSLKVPSPGGNYRQNRAHGIAPTSDGGLLMSMGFSEVTGIPRLSGEIIAKIDAAGNIVWSQEFNRPQYDISLTPVGETSDGGGLFIGTNGRGTNDTDDNAAVFVKTTDVGALAPYCIGGTTDGVDLELSFAPLSDPSPSQWGFFSVTLTVTNAGTEAATGVQVNFDKADEVTYKGGDEFNTSQGDFQYWGNEIWTVGNLAAGETATLDVNYFRLSANPFTAFAEISATNEADADSTPGNGTCCTATEDDEAAVAIGSGSARSVSGRTLLEDNISAREGFAILNAAPNPFSEQMTLNVYAHESQSSEVVIYDVLGRPVLRQAVDLSEGHNSIEVDASDLPVGFLVVKMSPEHRYLRQVRVVKVRD